MGNNKILVKTTNQIPTPSPVPTPTSPELIAINAVLDIAKESMRCFTDYMKCKEHEITERQRIRACLSAVIEKIGAQKDMYIKTIEKNYAERKELYTKADAALQKALELQDIDMLKCTYNYILTVYNGSGNSTVQLANDFMGNNNKIIEFLK